MRRAAYLAAAIGLGTVFLAGCSQTPCDRADAVDANARYGDCSLTSKPAPLGASCPSAIGSCSDADKKVLDGIVDCFDKLPVCAAADQATWTTQYNGCYAPAQTLSEACRTAVFAGTLPGEEDAGVDAGVQDAGYPPDTTDGGALNLYVTADETRIALAWTASQPGQVDHWDLFGINAAEVHEPAVTLAPLPMFATRDVGAGVKMSYFVLGLNAEGTVISGEVDGGTPPPPTDGGTPQCQGALDCPTDQVCNLGACQTLACNGNSNICPAGYLCGGTSNVCERQFGFSDGGTNDAGVVDAGTAPQAPLPFVSELQTISTAAPQYSAERIVSSFVGINPDIAPIDTARQFVIMDQEGQVFGYFTQDRGRTYKSVPIDPVGQHPHVAFEPISQTMFACYNAVGGVRVRASHDLGRTWPSSLGVDLANAAPDDGGTAQLISDCDVAPWTDGKALVTAIDGDSIKMWTVTKDMNVTGPEIAFAGTTNLYSPRGAQLATLPSDFIIDIVFYVSRPLISGGTDQDVYGVHREAGGAFSQPLPLQASNPYPQTNPAVAIDPVTKRGVAAYVSKEGSPAAETVYVTMWMPSKQWATGSDMNIFVKDKVSGQYLVMTDAKAGESWVARSPSVSVTPQGQITIAFAAGQDSTGAPDLRAYTVPFDLNIQNPIIGGNVKGWYVVQPNAGAEAISTTRIYNAQAGEVSGPLIVPDQQISTWYLLVEGVGSLGETANRPVVISKPQ